MNNNNNFNLINNMNQELEMKNNDFMKLISQNVKNKRFIEIKNIKLLTSMKYLLQFFYNIDVMPCIVKEMEINLTKVRQYQNTNNYFIEIFCIMFRNVERKARNLINEYEYRKDINNFIVEIFDRQDSQQIGIRPLTLYYNILSIINKEYRSLDKIIHYNLSNFSSFSFFNNFGQHLWPKMKNIIYQYKSAFKNPFIYSFSFLVIFAYKCSFCANILDIHQQGQNAYFLQLDLKSNDDTADKLIKNYFQQIPKNKVLYCKKCGRSGYVFEQIYMMNAPNFLVMEFEDKYSINMETTINIVGYKASTEGPYIYELMAVIIYDSGKYDIRTTSHENNWSRIKFLSFNNPSLAVYRKIK
jgi:hypothetical protein